MRFLRGEKNDALRVKYEVRDGYNYLIFCYNLRPSIPQRGININFNSPNDQKQFIKFHVSFQSFGKLFRPVNF